MKLQSLSGVALATAVAGLFAASNANAHDGHDHGHDGAEAKIRCEASSACKGQGACKSAKNACKGQNACMGEAFTMQKSEADCKAAQEIARKGM